MIKIIKRLLLLVLIAIIIVVSYFVYSGYKLYKEAINETSIEERVKELKEETEHYTKYSELPENYVNAILAVEDRKFFEHRGINVLSILRAVLNDVKAQKPVEGGSTITQQLAKNIYFTQKKEMTRKVAEVFMSFEIEKKLSKEEIFELYVNTIYFGDGYYCVYDASQGYFNKDVKDMNLYECTLLAGIPNAPSVYSPTKNAELSKQRHQQVLNKMVRFGYLSQEEADLVMNQYK